MIVVSLTVCPIIAIINCLYTPYSNSSRISLTVKMVLLIWTSFRNQPGCICVRLHFPHSYTRILASIFRIDLLSDFLFSIIASKLIERILWHSPKNNVQDVNASEHYLRIAEQKVVDTLGVDAGRAKSGHMERSAWCQQTNKQQSQARVSRARQLRWECNLRQKIRRKHG